MAARKKKASRKKAAKKKTARKKAKRSTASVLGVRLPKSLKAFGKELRMDLNSLEKEIEAAGKGAGKQLTRVMRDASHQLGVLEARGEKEWRSRSKKVEREVEKLVKRARKAVAGPKKKARKKKARRKK
jgi:hypothetical protein